MKKIMVKILISFILTCLCTLNLFGQLEKIAESHKQIAFVDYIFEGNSGEYLCTQNIYTYANHIFNNRFEKVSEENKKKYKSSYFIGIEANNNSVSHYRYKDNKVFNLYYNFSTKESDFKTIKLSDFKNSINSKLEYNNKSIYAFTLNKGKKKYYGAKYDSKTGELQTKFDVDIDEIKDIGQYDNQKSFFLKDGRVVTVVSYTLKDIRKKGIIIFLFDKELKLLDKYVYKREIYVALNIAAKMTENTELHDEEVYLWSREVISNNMYLLKCSFEGDKINASNKRLLLDNISLNILNPSIDEKSYTSIFQQIVTNMKEDKYIENPGLGYRIDGIYKQGNFTFINYGIYQSVKGGATGTLNLCGVFKIDSSGNIIENWVIECHFFDENIKRNEYDYYPIQKILCMQKKEKLYYFYFHKLQLKGFVLEEGAKIKELETQTFGNPFRREIHLDDVTLIPVYKMNKVAVKVGTRYMGNFDYTVYEF